LIKAIFGIYIFLNAFPVKDICCIDIPLENNFFKQVFTKFEMSIPLNVLIIFIHKINYIIRIRKDKVNIMDD